MTTTLQQNLDELREDPEAIAWPERRQVLHQAFDALTSAHWRIGLDVIGLLAHDANWKIRQDIAESLVHLPEVDANRLTEILSDDRNRFVKSAVASAIKRRKREARERQQQAHQRAARRRRRKRFEKKYGAEMAEVMDAMAERMFAELVGSLTHDFLNAFAPITSSCGHLLSLAQKGDVPAAMVTRYASRIDSCGDVVRRLILDMRNYAAPTPPERQSVLLSRLVDDAVANVLQRFEEERRDVSGIRLQVDVDGQIVVPIERELMLMAIVNILRNAYEAHATAPFHFKPGKVWISSAREGNSAVLRIRDNGMGISPEDLAEIRQFEPGGTSKKQHGTGFGLPIAQRRVADHGGQLRITSIENEGTTISISLPMEES